MILNQDTSGQETRISMKVVRKFAPLLRNKEKFDNELAKQTKEEGETASQKFFDDFQNPQEYAYAVQFMQFSFDQSTMERIHTETVECENAFWEFWNALAHEQQTLIQRGLLCACE